MINELNYHDNYCNCASHKHCLTEVTRWEMINSGKTKSPDRFLKSKNYSPKDFKNVDFEDLFVNDTFTTAHLSELQSDEVAYSFTVPSGVTTFA